MKNILLNTIILLSLIMHVNAQNTVISMDPNYANQIFYSMQNGEISNISNEDWDIAFSTNAYSSTIRINDGKGVELYTCHLGDTSYWSAINSSITNTLTAPMYNSDTGWSVGAFDINITNGFDYGWGVYSMITHEIIGDSLFIIKTINGNWKKLWVEKKVSGTVYFKYADLDGSNLITQNIDATNYNAKNFVYFSLDQNNIIDREPDASSWDITFTKYITPVQGMPYPVTGVLHNNGVNVAKAENVTSPLSYTDYSAHVFEKEINTIGYEWKSYQGTYIITPNLCYFVHDLYGNIWRLVFTAFEGMSTGNIEFNTELMNSSTSTEHIKEISSFAIFPNPTSDNSTLIYEVSANLPEVIISDMTGRIVYKSLLNKNEFATIELPTSYLESGIYLVTITENKKSLFTEKLIVE